MTTVGIVVAAGMGTRFGGSKAEATLDGRPLWEWGRATLMGGGVDDVLVVGDVPGGIPGGARRRDSVRAGLVAASSASHVVVHDAARPLATSGLVAAVIARLREGDAAGVVPAVPVVDTLKRVDGDAVVVTVARADLVAVQTPQAFDRVVLLRAHDGDDADATDDAELLERAGERVVIVPGEPTNLKVTYRSDLDLARAML